MIEKTRPKDHAVVLTEERIRIVQEIADRVDGYCFRNRHRRN